MILNWWLIVVACVICVMIVGLIFYLLVLYTSIEDRNQAWLPKLIVILGLSLACFAVLLLPFDIANKQNPLRLGSEGGGIDTALLWQIVLWSIAGFSIVIVPFATFYYESWDPDSRTFLRQIAPAVGQTLFCIVVFTVLLILLWYFVGFADIPSQHYIANPQYFSFINDDSIELTSTSSFRILTLQVSVFIYAVGLLSAIGWIAFAMFGGAGLSYLPIDLVSDWVQRPRPMTLDEYARRKEDIALRSAFLLQIGKKLGNKFRDMQTNRSRRRRVNLFRAEVRELESYHERLVISYSDRGGSPLVALGLLIVGVASVVLSVVWILHVIIYNMADVDPFLNTFFKTLDDVFSLFGVLAYSVFSFYLLWAVIKGVFRVASKLFIIDMYPMKVGDTLMNSFLFNTFVILISVVPVVQFCSLSFREYAANTVVDVMFSTYVLRLRGLGYIMIYMQYILMLSAAGAIASVLLCPRKDATPRDFE
jgi:LMBR1 domain-containing protein 1